MSELAEVDKGDRLGLYLTVGFAAVGIVGAIVSTVAPLIEVAPGHDIPVLVPLTGQVAMLPVGPGGAPFEAAIETGTVVVADPAPATLFALWAQPIALGLAASACLVLVAMFCLRLARAQVFDRGTARLAIIAAGVVTVGWVANTVFTNMSTNGALAAVSAGTYDSALFAVNLGPAIAVFALAAIGTALQIGERMQRETAGLV